MATEPISVIIPVYNGAAYLEEAVASIRRQAFAVDEIVVVDDGSTDGSAALAATLGEDVRVVSQDNAGPAAARNRGIEMARNEIIAFLDADDLWPDDKLALQLPVLLRDPAIDMVLGLLQYFRDNPSAPGGRETLPPIFLFVVGCGIYRKRIFDAVGLFEETMRFAEDTDWFLRSREANIRMKVVKAASILYRRHETNITNTLDHSALGFIRSVKRSLDRRREGGGGASELPNVAPEDIIEVPDRE